MIFREINVFTETLKEVTCKELISRIILSVFPFYFFLSSILFWFTIVVKHNYTHGH